MALVTDACCVPVTGSSIDDELCEVLCQGLAENSSMTSINFSSEFHADGRGAAPLLSYGS